MTDLEAWDQDGHDFGWTMPSAPWWKRLPVIRHVRAAWHRSRVRQHQAFWTIATGALHSGYDEWVLWGIAHGKELSDD